MTTLDDLDWYRKELRRAQDSHDHEMALLIVWSHETAEGLILKYKRLYEAEMGRLKATHAARVRWLESEMARLGGGLDKDNTPRV